MDRLWGTKTILGPAHVHSTQAGIIRDILHGSISHHSRVVYPWAIVLILCPSISKQLNFKIAIVNVVHHML